MGNSRQRKKTQTPMPKLLLASKSPRRRQILSALGIPFTVDSAPTDETLPDGMHPRDGVVLLAIRKGEAARTLGDGDTWILSSDTLVEADGAALGKPADAADAVRMLRLLSGQTHRVHTGVAVRRGDVVFADAATTAVTFRSLTEEEIAAYVESGEPMDKAGAYGIQGAAGAFVRRVEGDMDTVIGLSVTLTKRLLAEAGFPLPPKPSSAPASTGKKTEKTATRTTSAQNGARGASLSLKEGRARMQAATEGLKTLFPEAICALEYDGDPWKLLVMGRLSAQCTDHRVNIVCKELFTKYPTYTHMAQADLQELEDIVRPCGLYRRKAADLRDASVRLRDVYGGRLPDTMDELLTFPGVGRKIANLLLGDIYGAEAVVCDTHCIRICGRLGFYPESLRDPVRIEKLLRQVMPHGEGSDFCHRVVMLGRTVCTARAPACADCSLRQICAHAKGQGAE